MCRASIFLVPEHVGKLRRETNSRVQEEGEEEEAEDTALRLLTCLPRPSYHSNNRNDNDIDRHQP